MRDDAEDVCWSQRRVRETLLIELLHLAHPILHQPNSCARSDPILGAIYGRECCRTFCRKQQERGLVLLQRRDNLIALVPGLQIASILEHCLGILAPMTQSRSLSAHRFGRYLCSDGVWFALP
jgi:hypothetical protein